MSRYILAVDQSTQGTKGLLFDENGVLAARADRLHRQIVNDKGASDTWHWSTAEVAALSGNAVFVSLCRCANPQLTLPSTTQQIASVFTAKAQLPGTACINSFCKMSPFI